MPFWEERAYCFLATEPDALRKLKSTLAEKVVFLSISGPDKMDELSIKAIISQLAKCDRTTLDSVLDELTEPYTLPAAMVNTSALLVLRNSSQRIGSHGFTHQPLTEIDDVESELSASKKALSEHLEGDEVDALSFPHGAYSAKILKLCETSGYDYIFTSESKLNHIKSRAHGKFPIGRIHISQRQLEDFNGTFQPALLATWLFLRPVSNHTEAIR